MTNSYLDFDLEIGRNNVGIYPVQARWQGNEAYHEATLPSDSDPTRLRKEIEDAVLDSPLRRRRAFSSNEETVRYFGQRLFDFALSGEVLAQLRACQRAAKSQSHDGVRLRLRILDPELAGLPWEYLYDSRLRDFIALDPTLPIVRYLHHPQAVPPLQVSLPLRILAMVASPINLATLDVEAEKQRVEQAVRTLQAAGRVELVWLPRDGALDLQTALRKGPWHIFHFVGHGDFDAQRDEGYLVLCNPRNKQAETLYATQLARLLAAQSNNLRFVLLNACESARGSSSDIFSSTAETLINRDIPAVLAMQYSITDDAATIFAQHLYQALADGLPIDRSVAEARNALSLADSRNLEWGVPVLHMRSPNGMLFEVGKSGKVVGLQSVESEVRSAEVGHVVDQAQPVPRNTPSDATPSDVPTEKAPSVPLVVEINTADNANTISTQPIFRDAEKPAELDPTPIIQDKEIKSSTPQPAQTRKRNWLRISMAAVGVIVVGITGVMGVSTWQERVRQANATATQQTVFILPPTATAVPPTTTAVPQIIIIPAAATTWAVQVQPTMTAIAMQAKGTMQSTAPTLLPLVERFGIHLVLVPGGDFLMGSPEGVGESDEHPQSKIHLDDFWIGQTEITNAQFRPFVEGDGYSNKTYWTDAGWKWRSDNSITQPAYWTDTEWNQPEYPVVGVSWYEAIAYVRWLSKETGVAIRLPSEAEWEKAARGVNGQTYPWGEDEPTATLLNYFGTGLQRTASVGSYPAGASPYAILDMAGNVWEWNSTAWGGCDSKPGFAYPYRGDDGREKLDAEGCRLLRSGSWNYPSGNVRGASRYVFYPEKRLHYLGFRVVAVEWKA